MASLLEWPSRGEGTPTGPPHGRATAALRSPVVFLLFLFVFLSRRRDQARILFWDRGGFVLYCKRLERGCFRLPTLVAGATSVELEGPQLVMLLDGIDLGAVRPVPRWRPPVAEVPCRI